MKGENALLLLPRGAISGMHEHAKTINVIIYSVERISKLFQELCCT